MKENPTNKSCCGWHFHYSENNCRIRSNGQDESKAMVEAQAKIKSEAEAKAKIQAARRPKPKLRTNKPTLGHFIPQEILDVDKKQNQPKSDLRVNSGRIEPIDDSRDTKF